MRPLAWICQTDLRDFRRSVFRWYRAHRRNLPWRATSDPYTVWVAEILLQQTRVETALPYYRQFVRRFPTVGSLASARSESVLRVWQGLGYYHRALHLHRAAKQMMRGHCGRFPSELAALRRLPGIGRYTAAAIESFAFGRRAGILEANTARLWTRLCAAAGDPRRAPLRDELWRLAEQVLPRRGCADFNQAVMDLGALVCTPHRPDCLRCPLRTYCRAFAAGRVERYPQARTQRAPTSVEQVAVVVWSGANVLVRKRCEHGRWPKLWELPFVECKSGETLRCAARRAVSSATPRPVRLGTRHRSIRYSVTCFRVRLYCFDAQINGTRAVLGNHFVAERCRWVPVTQLDRLPFSAPHRRLLETLRPPALVRGRRAAV